ncbi:cellulose biosynthesis protein BcsN [Rhodoblastus sp.]|uniref:cellulose biosynthesis protein BcsN n=1 Tax=Rhodoblastus sp. TaxID=1962975 RepID=UPI00260655CB|nr:cellulose biosynthesis protein BcsN [Rhodoblastus sp.]
MKKAFVLLPLALALAACQGREQGGASNLDMMALAATTPPEQKFDAKPHPIPVESALARLPQGAGQPTSALERRYPNGYSQIVRLASDVGGLESQVEIAVQNGKTLYSSKKAPVWKPGEAGIRDELAREFPDMRMQVVANGGFSNRYGRIGMAVGRRGETLRCIYAWQYIDDARRSFENGRRIRLEDGAEAAPASLRIKLCRGDATIDDLVNDARQVVIDIPEDYGATETIATESPRPPRTVAHRTRTRRYRHAKSPPAGFSPSEDIAPMTPYTTAEGLRYMAPVDSPPRPMAPARSAVAIGTDLPPQALRGPPD